MEVLKQEVQEDLQGGFYAVLLHEHEVKKSRLMDVNRKLALKLACDWNQDDAAQSLLHSLAQEEEQAVRDANLARCINDVADGAAVVILAAYGEDSEEACSHRASD